MFFREFTMKSSSISRIHCLFREFNTNLLKCYVSFSRIHSVFTILISRIYYIFTLSCAKSPWFYYLIRKITSNSLSLFRENNINSLSLARNHYDFTIFLANVLRIYYLFTTMNLEIDLQNDNVITASLIATHIVCSVFKLSNIDVMST